VTRQKFNALVVPFCTHTWVLKNGLSKSASFETLIPSLVGQVVAALRCDLAGDSSGCINLLQANPVDLRAERYLLADGAGSVGYNGSIYLASVFKLELFGRLKSEFRMGHLANDLYFDCLISGGDLVFSFIGEHTCPHLAPA